MGIVEAKDRPENLRFTCSHCFPGHWSFVHNPGTSLVARIIVGWDPLVFQLDVIFSSPQIICMKATFGDLSSIFLSVVYGLNQALGKRNLWVDVRYLGTVIGDNPWIQIGGFNVVRYALTWSNRRGGMGVNKSKIDRVLINSAWLDKFSDSKAVFLTLGVSDHCSTMVTVMPASHVRRPFKIFNFWLKNSKFRDALIASWDAPLDTSLRSRLGLKLKCLKLVLKALNHHYYSDITGRVATLRMKLNQFQAQCQGDPDNLTLKEREHEMYLKFVKLSNAEEVFKKQKSRPEEIKLEILNYYIGLLGTPFGEKWCAFHALRLPLKKRASNDFKAGLTRGVTQEEIKSAMCSIKGDKAPGPDTSAFFQHNWSVVGKDVIDAVGIMPQSWNSTILSINQKCVTKILANRIQALLPSFINPCQFAFVKGCSIVDNILLIQEIVKSYHKAEESSIYLAGVTQTHQSELCSIFPIPVSTLPVRYLGVPLISTSFKSEDCVQFKDKTLNRIQSWTNKKLSYGGRAKLVQFVLFSIQVYWSSIFIIPTKVLKDIDKVLRAFLWSGPELKAFGAKIAWDYVCSPKAEGGSGFRHLSTWNKGAMSRHIWAICNKADTL
ncbi:uncharacterized protein LOC131317484 [Rhododendron vialii]|uniref:uncharacterized protein LOC131317484 n=1 Tax=Rhododendron vialii TaxID=182163 RepID=UPI00265E05F5|nr:uncharacterized protein LOC131317484 [Rhododendron vialii]